MMFLSVLHHMSFVMKVKVPQLFPALCNPMDCILNSPGQNTGVGSLFLLQASFPTQGSNPDFPQGRFFTS